MTSYIGFGNDTLENQPVVNEGDMIVCNKCGDKHELITGIDDKGNKSETLYFYKCRDSTYLGAVNKRLVTGVKPDASGKI